MKQNTHVGLDHHIAVGCHTGVAKALKLHSNAIGHAYIQTKYAQHVLCHNGLPLPLKRICRHEGVNLPIGRDSLLLLTPA